MPFGLITDEELKSCHDNVYFPRAAEDHIRLSVKCSEHKNQPHPYRQLPSEWCRQLSAGDVFCPYGYLPPVSAEPVAGATDNIDTEVPALTPCDLEKLSQEAVSRRRVTSSRQFLTVFAGIAALVATIVAAVCIVSTPHAAYVQQPNVVLEVSDVEFFPDTFEEAMGTCFTAELLSVSDIDNIVSTSDIATFSPDADTPTVLTEANMSLIENALDDFGSYDVGFLFADIETGRGYAYNIDEVIYGASTFKLPLATYILAAADDEETPVEDYVNALIYSSIAYSDNDAFVALSSSFSGEGFHTWLENAGVDAGIVDSGDFATYDVRDAAKMWLAIYRYMSSGSDDATWLAEVASDTNLSPIRDAVTKYEVYVEPDARGIAEELPYREYPNVSSDGAVVYNKAGWISEGGKYNATNDNAIISCGGRDYLMCIMCDEPYSQ